MDRESDTKLLGQRNWGRGEESEQRLEKQAEDRRGHMNN
jgi:hypothetical protein